MLDATKTDRRWLIYTTPHEGLRDFLERAGEVGELVHAKGVHWDLEMGALAEAFAHKRSDVRAFMVDQIPGYPKGFRVACGVPNSSRRLALALGFPDPKSAMDVVRAYRDRMKTHRPVAPRVVKSGPILQNVQRDDEVDLFKFPVPRLHEEDGGRYIGTDDIVVMRDPELDWVNASTYRVQIHSKNSTGLWMSPGKQGYQIMQKYFRMGQPCPVLVSCGHDPLLALAGGQNVRFGTSEYDFAGGHRGAPIDVVLSELHGLPMPAHAEIVIEGSIHPDDLEDEGPFGEFTGYYASPQSKQPVIRVKRVYHRNDPILSIASPMRPPSDYSYSRCIINSAMIWDDVEHAGISGVRGVWTHECAATRLFNVISIKQAYAGHSKQAATVAATCKSGAYLGRFTVVVDDDVDPTNLDDVIWAMSTRCDPVKDIDLIRDMWSSPLDPVIPYDPAAKAYLSNRATIAACRPYARLNDYPAVARARASVLAAVKEKFADLLAQA
jgi:4-hydroxy-3-polyprenylbenzoate decarboxylase